MKTGDNVLISPEARIYAVDYMTSTSGEILGITIKYQENWEPDVK